MTPHGHFSWNELVTHDPERIKKFYADTVGWTYQGNPLDEGYTYWIALMNDVPVAGIFPVNGRAGYENIRDNWMPYLAVDDVDERIKAAVAAGAKLVRPIFDVPDVGRLAVFFEPTGAGVGWMTPVA